MNQVVPIPRALNRSDYLPIIRALRPRLGDEELNFRASLMLISARASAAKETACEPAWAVLNVVQVQASDAATNFRIPLDDLKEIRRICLNCVASAASFDTLYRPREGEAA